FFRFAAAGPASRTQGEILPAVGDSATPVLACCAFPAPAMPANNAEVAILRIVRFIIATFPSKRASTHGGDLQLTVMALLSLIVCWARCNQGSSQPILIYRHVPATCCRSRCASWDRHVEYAQDGKNTLPPCRYRLRCPPPADIRRR